MMDLNHSSSYGYLRLKFISRFEAEPRAGHFDGRGLYRRVSFDVIYNGWGQVWLCLVGTHPAHKFGEVSVSAGGHTLYRSDWIDVVGGVPAP